jgi:(R,R)-butanediol dehydrogenase/meso-butanediol dehydrogenase/diacetyl reductase
MRAAVMQGIRQPLSCTSVPDPKPAQGELVVKVARCGICGSDLHIAEDPAFGKGAGYILGHEFAGEVAAVGRGTQGVAVGDLVSVIPLQSCGHCPACVAGEVAWCGQFGLQGGGYAEYAVTRPNQCIKLPQALSLADGAIIEPLAVALHGIHMSGLKFGEKVLILGAGPIGLAVAFWARRAGASRVVMQDVANYQRARALAMGAHEFVVQPDDPVGSAERAISGKADIVYECVGIPGLIEQAVKQVRNRGTILLLGLCTRPDTFNSFAMLSKEIRLITSAFFTRGEYVEALRALEDGAAEPRALVTGTISLEETPEAFETLRRRTEHCKLLIAP